MRAIIESNRIYPGAARRRKLEGTAIVQIRINARGDIIAQRFVQSTGHHSLDKAVLDMLTASDPLPAIPQALGTSSLSVKIPIGFKLR